MADLLEIENDSQRYIDVLGGERPMPSFRKAPKRIEKLVRRLSKEEFARRPTNGGWSILEVLAHLADGEVIFGARLRMIAAHETPEIAAYDEKLFALRLGVENARASDLLRDFGAVRAANVSLLERLPPGAFERAGRHAERGLESIAVLLTRIAGHDRLHELQIERVKVEIAGKKKLGKKR